MATWKKIVVSGSAITQLDNNIGYVSTGSALTIGAIPYVSAATKIQTSSIFFDSSTKNIGIGTLTPGDAKLHVYNYNEDVFGPETPDGIYSFLNRSYLGTGNEPNNYRSGYFKTTITNSDTGQQVLQNIIGLETDLALLNGNTGTLTASLAAAYATSAPTIGNGARAVTYANFYGTPLYVEGSVGTYYDIYLPGVDPTSTGTLTNKYGIYQADGTLKNFFSGSIGVGTNSPTSSIHIVETLPTITLGAKSQVTAAGTVLGSIDFQDAYTAGIRPQATIDVVRGATGGAGVFPTDLVFYNNNSGAGTGLKEAFRLKYDGAARISGSLEITSISQATTDTDKFLTSDGGTLKYVSGSQLLTYIGGQAALTNPVTGTGTSGYVAYWNGTNTITGESNLFWNASNDRLGIKQGTPLYNLDVTGDARITSHLIVGGDLTVSGTTTVIDTANLLVEDKFILLASGSNSATDGGIIVQQAAGGGGVALFYDGGDARWAVSSSVPHDATTVTPAAYMGIVNNVAATTNVAAAYTKPGNINIDSSGDIWIYA